MLLYCNSAMSDSLKALIDHAARNNGSMVNQEKDDSYIGCSKCSRMRWFLSSLYDNMCIA